MVYLPSENCADLKVGGAISILNHDGVSPSMGRMTSHI